MINQHESFLRYILDAVKRLFNITWDWWVIFGLLKWKKKKTKHLDIHSILEDRNDILI